MNPSSPFEDLLQGCLDGTLDEAQQRELARLLHESGEAREALRAYLRIEGGLLTLARAGSLGSRVPRSPEALTAGPSSPHRHRLRRRLVTRMAILTAALLLGAGGVYWFALAPRPVNPAPPPALAHVVEVEGSVEIVSPTGASRPAAVRQPLRAGDALRTGQGNSVAVIEFADTTRLELSPETRIRLPEDGTRGVRLIEGVVRGNESRPADRPPLVVTTDAARVRVEGDRFVVSSTSPVSLRVDMEEGKAEVVRRHDHKSLTAQSGAAIFVEAEAKDMVIGSMPRFVTEPRRVLGFPGAWAVFFESDGQHVLAASYHEIRRFGPNPAVEKTILSTDRSNGRLAAFSRDGRTLAVYRGLRPGDSVLLWDVLTRAQRVRIESPRIFDRRFVLAPDATWLAAVEKDKSRHVLRVWDGNKGTRRFSLPSKMRINCLAATPDSKFLAAGLVNMGQRDPNRILLLDVRKGRQVATLPTRAYPLTALAFSPDGRYLAAGITGMVQLWDVEKRELVRTIRGFERVLLTLAFSPDGRLLAGGTQDGQVWIWDAQRGEEVQLIKAGTSGVRVLTFSPDGRSLATGGIKRHPIMIWDVIQPQARQPEIRRPTRI